MLVWQVETVEEEGEGILIDCPVCGEQKAIGSPSETRQTWRLYWVLPFLWQRWTRVICSACDATLVSRLPLRELLEALPEERQRALYAAVPMLGRFVVAVSVPLGFVPFVGLLVTVTGFVMSMRYRGLLRVLAGFMVAVSLGATIAGGDILLEHWRASRAVAGRLERPPATPGNSSPLQQRIVPPAPSDEAPPDVAGSSVRDEASAVRPDATAPPEPTPPEPTDFPSQFAPRRRAEPVRLTGMAPRDAVNQLAEKHGRAKVLLLVIHERVALRDDPLLTENLASLCDRGEQPHIYVSPSGDPIAAVVSPVSDFESLPTRLDFGLVTSTDPQERKIVVESFDSPAALARLLPAPAWPSPAVGESSAGPDPSPAAPSAEPPAAVPPASDALGRLLGEIASGGAMRHFSIDKLAEMPVDEGRRAQVAAMLAKNLKDANPFVRESSVKALGAWWTPETLPDLIALAADDDFATRLSAYEVLAATKTPEAATAIAQGLGKDPMRAAQALASMGGVGEDAAIAALRSRDERTLREACNVLEKIGTKKALAPLRSLTRHSSRMVQMRAEMTVRAIQARE